MKDDAKITKSYVLPNKKITFLLYPVRFNILGLKIPQNSMKFSDFPRIFNKIPYICIGLTK